MGNNGVRERAFTVVELLIVIAVLGILASVATVAFNGIQNRARAAKSYTEYSAIAENIGSYTKRDLFPGSISDCPTPATANMCIVPKTGQVLDYYAFNPTGPGRYYHGLHSRTKPAFELTVRNPDGFYYGGNAEIQKDPALPDREFTQYMDMAPIINQYGLRKYKISFDIKSESIANFSTVRVYMQNGSGARYDFNADVPVTTSYTRQSVTVTPTGPNTTFTQSILAFYGTYNTGNIPTIKNVTIEAG